MKTCKLYSTLFVLTLAAKGLTAQVYRPGGTIDIGGTGGWDYLAVDAPSGRLFVSHAGDVEVIDLTSNKLIGKVTGMKRVHGIAFADELNTGFISDGGSDQVFVFDLKTLSVKQTVQAGGNPDGIVYDRPSQRLFAFNGRTRDATVIDAVKGTVEGTIALGGKPEFPVSDGQGNVYDNIEDRSEMVQIDSKSMKVKARWPVAPCESPSGLAIDTAGRRLFAVCDNKMMAVVDADSGKVVATPEIGEGPDAAGFDPGTKLGFSSNGGDGTVTIVRKNGKGGYTVAGNVATVKGARTMALDPASHKIYLSSAEYAPAPAATAGNARARPSIKPGTFKVIVLAPQQ